MMLLITVALAAVGPTLVWGQNCANVRCPSLTPGEDCIQVSRPGMCCQVVICSDADALRHGLITAEELAAATARPLPVALADATGIEVAAAFDTAPAPRPVPRPTTRPAPRATTTTTPRPTAAPAAQRPLPFGSSIGGGFSGGALSNQVSTRSQGFADSFGSSSSGGALSSQGSRGSQGVATSFGALPLRPTSPRSGQVAFSAPASAQFFEESNSFVPNRHVVFSRGQSNEPSLVLNQVSNGSQRPSAGSSSSIGGSHNSFSRAQLGQTFDSSRRSNADTTGPFGPPSPRRPSPQLHRAPTAGYSTNNVDHSTVGCLINGDLVHDGARKMVFHSGHCHDCLCSNENFGGYRCKEATLGECSHGKTGSVCLIDGELVAEGERKMVSHSGYCHDCLCSNEKFGGYRCKEAKLGECSHGKTDNVCIIDGERVAEGERKMVSHSGHCHDCLCSNENFGGYRCKEATLGECSHGKIGEVCLIDDEIVAEGERKMVSHSGHCHDCLCSNENFGGYRCKEATLGECSHRNTGSVCLIDGELVDEGERKMVSHAGHCHDCLCSNRNFGGYMCREATLGECSHGKTGNVCMIDGELVGEGERKLVSHSGQCHDCLCSSENFGIDNGGYRCKVPTPGPCVYSSI